MTNHKHLREATGQTFIFHDEDTHEFEIFTDLKQLENYLSDCMTSERVDEELNLKVYRVDAVSECIEVDRRTSEYCPLCNDGNTLEEVLEGTDLDECPHCEGAGRVYSDEPDKPWKHLEDVEIRWEMEPHVSEMGPTVLALLDENEALKAEVERLRRAQEKSHQIAISAVLHCMAAARNSQKFGGALMLDDRLMNDSDYAHGVIEKFKKMALGGSNDEG